jgi:large subunit ribosomal protein L21
MEPYAVVETGSKQYRVKVNDKLIVERLEAEPGSKVELRPVLAVSDGTSLRIGTPEIEDAAVACTVVNQTRGPKLRIFKKRRRKTYARRKGHRQQLTVLKVESIQ